MTFKEWFDKEYKFNAPHPYSLTAILPNFEAYNANNMLIKGENNERDAGEELLKQYLPPEKVKTLTKT